MGMATMSTDSNLRKWAWICVYLHTDEWTWLPYIGGGKGGARGLKPPLRMISREIILLGVGLKTVIKIEIL